MEKFPEYLLFQEYFQLVDTYSVYSKQIKTKEGEYWDYGYTTSKSHLEMGMTAIAPWILSLSTILSSLSPKRVSNVSYIQFRISMHREQELISHHIIV